MKLNYKRTLLVGFAFFLISAFWQAYDATIPPDPYQQIWHEPDLVRRDYGVG